MPTQEELDRKAEEVRELRQSLSQSEAQREEEAAERSRERKMERLEAEEQRLRRRLDAENRRSSKKSESGSTDDQTRDELYERAQELDIEGRSDMDKDELQKAVTVAERSRSTTSRPTVTGTSTPEKKE